MASYLGSDWTEQGRNGFVDPGSLRPSAGQVGISPCLHNWEASGMCWSPPSIFSSSSGAGELGGLEAMCWLTGAKAWDLLSALSALPSRLAFWGHWLETISWEKAHPAWAGGLPGKWEGEVISVNTSALVGILLVAFCLHPCSLSTIHSCTEWDTVAQEEGVTWVALFQE